MQVGWVRLEGRRKKETILKNQRLGKRGRRSRSGERMILVVRTQLVPAKEWERSGEMAEESARRGGSRGQKEQFRCALRSWRTRPTSWQAAP